MTVEEVSSLISRLPGLHPSVTSSLRDQLVDGDALLLLQSREDLTLQDSKQPLPLGVWVKIKYLKWLISGEECSF